MPKNPPVAITLTCDVEIVLTDRVTFLPTGMRGEWDGEVRGDIDERPLYRCTMDSGVVVYIRRDEFAPIDNV